MTDWNLILRNINNESIFYDFVDRNISGRELLRSLTPDVRPTVSTAFRRRGTDGVRELARKALSRRA